MQVLLRPLTIAFAFAVAAPATAFTPWVPGREKVDPVVLTGDLFSQFDESYQSFLISSPGKYRLSWTFDRPLGFNSYGEEEVMVISYRFGWVLDEYEGGEWVWGTSEDFDDYIHVSSAGSVMLEIGEPQIFDNWGDGYYQTTYWHYLSGIGINPGYELESRVGFRVTLTQVPEPASWALMIAGFGLAGGALRRRRERPGVQA